MTIDVSANKFLKWLQLLLLLAILGLLLWSKPWDASSTNETARTIRVSGEATLEATPDEFVFYPYFEEKGSDQDALKATLTKQANDAVEAIKALGVAEDKIALDASSYDRWYWEKDEQGVLTASLTVTVDNKDKAQEVQDYLLNTSAKGQLTPQGVFSKAKQKELDAQAIKEASADARSKAEAQATLFDAKLGKVVTVEQGYDSVFPVAYNGRGIAEDVALEASSSFLPVLPGQDEYTQTVSVTYELK